jgi:hypothetical protein
MRKGHQILYTRFCISSTATKEELRRIRARQVTQMQHYSSCNVSNISSVRLASNAITDRRVSTKRESGSTRWSGGTKTWLRKPSRYSAHSGIASVTEGLTRQLRPATVAWPNCNDPKAVWSLRRLLQLWRPSSGRRTGAKLPPQNAAAPLRVRQEASERLSLSARSTAVPVSRSGSEPGSGAEAVMFGRAVKVVL